MRILTVISNYNEQGSILDCIRDFQQNAPANADLLVVDNASTDASLDIVRREGVDYLAHPVNSGGSSGVIKTSLLYAYLSDYDVYTHMDGDNQHNAAELASLVEPIAEGSADLVVGSRFISKEGFQSSVPRRVAIHFFSTVVSALLRQRITDLTSGFRAYGRDVIRFFATQYRHELEACVQMIMVAGYAGFRIKEVPIAPKPRLTGRSEFTFTKAFAFPFYATISLIGTLVERKT
jgi:glycosyltransferase involved in cell wall biosynthesis